jgi:hypothetical protein
MVVHIRGLMVIATLSFLLLAAVVAVHAQGTDIIGELDALKYRANDLSGRMENEVLDLRGAYGTVNSTRALSADDRTHVRSMADKAVKDAGGWDGEITDIRRGLWDVESRYDARQMSRVNATIAEGRMDILRHDLDRLQGMSTEARILADRIMRGA